MSLKKIYTLIILVSWIVPSSAQVVADFNVSNTAACGSLQTNFYDQSTSSAGAIIDWQWDIGGVLSQKQNPGVILNEPGTYTVCLTVTDQEGNMASVCKEGLITVYPNPIASFTFDLTEGCAPSIVSFTNTSTSENGEISSLLWDVGGTVNVLESFDPAEVITTTYNLGGIYSASVTIEDEVGCKSTVSQQEIIEIFEIPQITLNYLILSSCSLPLEVEFLNNNPNPLTTYVWDFGNGETFTGPNPPLVSYTEEDVYDVTVTMNNGGCENTVVFEDYINTYPSTNFTTNEDTVCLGAGITFTDISNALVDSVLWDFGDGNTSSEINPTHVYSSEGCYEVMLIRFNGLCTDSITKPCLEILPRPSISYNLDNQFTCDLPALITLNAQSNGSGSFQWTFDVVSDTLTGPSVSLEINEPGLHYAHLNFQDDNGCEVVIDSIEIDVSIFEALLPLQEISGCIPLDVALGDSVIAEVPIVTWEWTVGNPAIFTSNDANPSFMLPDTGEYDVQLVVENEYGCIDTVYRSNYVQAGIPPEVDFNANPLDDCLAIERYFYDLSSTYADEWLWHFGETGFSFDQNPVYVFPDPDIYDVSLTAFHNGCPGSEFKAEYINVLKPRSSFAVDYNCEDPYTVDIQNTTIGADSLFWELILSETQRDTILDSLFSTYTFPTTGDYILSHYGKNDSTGCEHIYSDTIKIRDPKAAYTLDTLAGCSPISLYSTDLSTDADRYFFDGIYTGIDNDTIAEPIFTYNEGGVYAAPIMYVTDIHECRDSFQLADSIYINNIDARIQLPGAVCIPDSLFLMDNSRDTLGEIISWSWVINNGDFISSDENPAFFIEEESQYNVTLLVEDDWGCTDSTSQNIFGIFLDPEFIGDTLSCTSHGVLFTALVNNPNVVGYHWTFGDGGTSDYSKPFWTYTEEGTYTVCLTIDDVRGCSVTKCKENYVTIKDPVASFTADPLFDSCPPLLTNFTNTSINGVSFSWDFGDASGNSNLSNPSHVYTTPGEFDVALITEMSPHCSDTLLLEDYVVVDGPVADFSMHIDSSCTPLSMTMYAVSDEAYTYIWDFGNGEIDSVEQLVLTDTVNYMYTVVGKYTPKFIVKDDQGCIRSFTGEDIYVNDINLDFIHTSEILCGLPLSLELENLSTSTGVQTNYEWQINGPQVYSSEDFNPTISIDEAGKYEVLLIARTENCVDTLSVENSFEVGVLPNVSFEIDADQICEKVDVEFENTTAVGYGEIETWIWDFGDGTISNEFEPIHSFEGLETQEITLTAITDVGCMGNYVVQLPTFPSIEVEVSENKLICLGDSIDIWANISGEIPGSMYSWSADTTLSCQACLSPNASPQETNTYYFSAIHPNGCVSVDSVNIEVVPIYGPQLQLSADTTVCDGDTATIQIINYSPLFEYEWDTDDAGLDCYSGCNQVQASPDSSTFFNLTVYNELGCYKEDSIQVVVEKSIPDFVVDQKFICEDSSTMLEITFGNDPIWMSPEITCDGCTEVTINPDGDQYYYVSVLSDAGCRYLDSVFVNVVPTTSIEASGDGTICNGEAISLSGMGIGTPLWSPEETIDNPDDFTPNAFPTETTTYILTVTKDECVLRDSVEVEVIYKVDIETTGDTICPDEEASLLAEGLADEYLWYKNNTLVNEGITYQLPLSETAEYMVIGRMGLCEEDTSFVMAFVHPIVSIDLVTNYLIHSNSQVTVDLDYDPERNYSFDWFPVTGLSCTMCPTPKISELTMADAYTVTVTDEESGCLIEEEIFVRYNRECTPDVFGLPNIFSPNNDGRNDLYFISTLNEDEFIRMQIFDRWGELMFETDDITLAWDGTINGRSPVQGVYVVRVEAICPETGKTYSFFRDITLIR